MTGSAGPPGSSNDIQFTTTSNATVLNDGGHPVVTASPPTLQSRAGERNWSTRVMKKIHGNGYWSLIRVYEYDDTVSFKLMKGSWFKRIFWRPWHHWFAGGFITGEERGSLEVALGSVYLEIDERIELREKKKTHGKFVKNMMKTDPDNLKMIAGLDTLDKATKPAEAPKASGTVSSLSPTSKFTVAGTGTFYSSNSP